MITGVFCRIWYGCNKWFIFCLSRCRWLPLLLLSVLLESSRSPGGGGGKLVDEMIGGNLISFVDSGIFVFGIDS